ncbi:Longitudinals lacking protein-like [Armadillidium nasatum]|uniref:Longitudinals lacking protein-like n=1 Tax=Armadillidium nasatum TaxID=96803 RepID=A0A5N5TA11_9CRUS|nr:Longitudinals lacking protein-like [Armadillidium nasatum]
MICEMSRREEISWDDLVNIIDQIYTNYQTQELPQRSYPIQTPNKVTNKTTIPELIDLTNFQPQMTPPQHQLELQPQINVVPNKSNNNQYPVIAQPPTPPNYFSNHPNQPTFAQVTGQQPQRMKTSSPTDGSPLLYPLEDNPKIETPDISSFDTIAVTPESPSIIKLIEPSSIDDFTTLTSNSNSLTPKTNSSISNSIIQFHTLQVPPKDTLLVGVFIKDSKQDKLLTALVDTGAAGSLITSKTYSLLNSQNYPLFSTTYSGVQGIGGTVFPVYGIVTFQVQLSRTYITKPHPFIVVDDQVTNYDLILGYDFLSHEQLLPDLATKQLIKRNKNHLTIIAEDIRTLQSRDGIAMIDKDISLPPNKCITIPISIDHLIFNYNTLLLFTPNDSNKFIMDHIVLNYSPDQIIYLYCFNFNDNPIRVLVYYSKDHPLHFGNPNYTDICCLYCMGGIHYNLLNPTKSKLPQTAIDALSSFPILSAPVVVLHLLDSEESEEVENDILIENSPAPSIVTIDDWIIWHPKLRLICKDISMTCHHCQLGKISNIYHAPPMLKINTKFPFELVAVDLLQLPKSSKGNSYIFVLIDHYKTKRSPAEIIYSEAHDTRPNLPWTRFNEYWDEGNTNYKSFSIGQEVLLIGHSWISYLEDNYNPYVHNPGNHEVKFKRIMFSKFEDIPTALERELRPSTTHVIVFSIFRHAYKRMTLTRKGKSHKQYSVTFPDPDYRAESSVPIIKEMLMQIKNICPQAQLYIMIPVFPDLPYYNIYRNIKFAPTEVRDWYYSLPRSSAQHLHQDTHYVYKELMRLHSSEIRWPRKRTIALSENILTDCTLACDGQKFSVHKLVLVTCSDFFKSLLGDVSCQHPIIYLRGVNGMEMQSLIDFMYLGKIDVPHKDVPNLISTAESLKIKGLGVFNLNIYDRKDVSERMDLKRKRTFLTSNFNESLKHNRTSSPLSKQTSFESNLLSKSKSSDEVETLPVIAQCSGENAQESSKNKYLQEKDKNELFDKNVSSDSILNSLLRGTSFSSTSSNISNLETSVITNSCIITSENDLPPKESLTLTQLTALQPFAEKPSKSPINNFYDNRGQNEETKLVSFAYVGGEKIRTSEILEGLV